MYDLPSEDPGEPGLPDEFHDLQPQLLSATFWLAACAGLGGEALQADRIFTASDLNLYYDPNHTQWYKRPDWCAVVGVSRLYDEQDLRLSYVIWQEGVSPTVIVELLSPGTEKEDLGETEQEQDSPPTKWTVYEQILRVPYYVVFDRYTNQLQAFVLAGERYRQLELSTPKVWMPELGLGLGVWQGSYQGIERLWLRWYDDNQNWIPTEAEQERHRADRLAERLRELGVDPDTV